MRVGSRHKRVGCSVPRARVGGAGGRGRLNNLLKLSERNACFVKTEIA